MKSQLRFGHFRLSSTLIVPAVSLLLGLQHGLSYGIGNHNTYLLGGLRLFKPELFQSDWLVTQTSAYHTTFAYVAYLLYWLNADGWAVAMANVLSIALTVGFVYGIIATLYRDAEIRLPVFLLMATFVATTQTFSASGSYIFCRTFQPSSLASLAFMAGVYYYLRQRYLLSGIVLAVGGFFHINFLVLFFPLFGLAHLLLGRKGLVKRVFQQLGFCLVALIPLLPTAIAASLAPDADVGRKIFQEIHAPQHYLPMKFLSEFVPLVGWHILALVLVAPFLKSRFLTRDFAVLHLVQLGLIAVATGLTTLVLVPAVSQMYVWRLAPFSVVFALIIGGGAFVHSITRSDTSQAGLKTVVGIIVAAICLYGIWYYHVLWYGYRQLNIYLLLACGLLWISWVFLRKGDRFRAKGRMPLMIIFAAAVFLVGILVTLQDFRRKSSLIIGLPAHEADLYRWARDETAVETLFLIPPTLQNFRLNAQRSVIVDSKSTPILSGDLVEWHRRLGDISGQPNWTDRRELIAGFKNIDQESLTALHSKYHFNYAVVPVEVVDDNFPECDIVYSNPAWVVLSLYR